MNALACRNYLYPLRHNFAKACNDFIIGHVTRHSYIHKLTLAALTERKRQSKRNIRVRIEALGVPHGKLRAAHRPCHKAVDIKVRNINHTAAF